MRISLFMVVLMFIPVSVNAEGKCRTGDPYSYEAPHEMESCPEDIQIWLDRANGCHYYGNEIEDIGNDDADRSSILESHMEELDCAVIWCDFDDLFTKYEGDIIFSDVITSYAQSLYGDSELPVCDKSLKKKVSEE